MWKCTAVICFAVGVCVVEWNGHSLDECTYEEVQRIVGSVSPGISEIEISVKKCG